MIQFDHIWKIYPKQIGIKAHTALKNVSFFLDKGETLGLVGANGAGKSTCMRLLMDFIRPDKGTIRLLSESPSNPAIRRKIGYLPETACFPSNLSVMDMLRFTGAACHISSAPLSESIEKWLKLLNLWEVRNRPLRIYSKGMQQRANFAIALVCDPELLILDEPMSGLDPIGRDDIISLIQMLKAEGKSILFCSHLLEDVDRLVDRVLVLHKGEMLFHGKPSDLCERRQSSSFVDAFIGLVKMKNDNA
ncbi:MAG TPA: ABC transporter ATP-binding protein [Desulfobacteraceae bacterium]|nr:ABC transporter ATP-binding protein [Desulfobacteraceae bacterium]